MNICRYFFISLTSLILFACKQKTDITHAGNKVTVDPEQLIFPGKSVGLTKLNDAGSKVIENLGKPDISDAAMGKSVNVWYPDHNKKGYAMHMYFSTNIGVDDTARVKAVRVTSPTFKTNNHLNTGVLITDVSKQYTLKNIGMFKLKNTDRTIFDDSLAGVAFDTDRSGNVIGITVHETGKSALNAYMAFFGAVKSDKK